MPLLHQPEKTAALNLLNAANLPTADLTDQHLNYFWGFAADGKIVGVVGLEPVAGAGLLRSLVVSPTHRNRGIGTQLVAHAEHMAQQMGLRELYLLTSTAQEFFENFGYTSVSRQQAPAAIRSTREFANLCPANSLLMKKVLR